MGRRATVLTAVALAVAYLAGVGMHSAGAAGKIRYDVTPLDASWTNSIARDINEKGQVVGQGANSTGQARAFLWEDGPPMQDLGVPVGGNLSRARAINEGGAVVGEWRIQINRQQKLKAFLYQDGQMRDLNTLIPAGTGWDLTGAQAINENGQVVGSGTRNVGTQEETHAFLYSEGLPTDLGEVLGDPYSAAWGINDSGDVVGGAGGAEARSEAFAYRDGAAERLGNPGDFPASEAVGVNNSGQVIGWSFDAETNPPQGEAFIYEDGEDGTAKDAPLEPLSGDAYTRARDVDEAGRVVGWSRNDVDATPREQFSAVLWEERGPGEPRQAQDLNELLLPEDSGWKLVDAYAINEGGRIVGSGYYGDGPLQAFLLNPAYDFTGFFAPVDNPPTVNTAKAGQAIPVKFSLSGDQGLEVLAEGYPRSQQVACGSTAPVDGIEETEASGESGLTYDAASDEYSYVWKTDRSWTGCRQLVIKLDDGTTHRAVFSFAR